MNDVGLSKFLSQLVLVPRRERTSVAFWSGAHLGLVAWACKALSRGKGCK